MAVRHRSAALAKDKLNWTMLDCDKLDCGEASRYVTVETPRAAFDNVLAAWRSM
ncbi:hypothetical protein SAMN05444161_0566 [Rhizobiales bacterium GAS191]|nr:hypothetical protein SAMN05519103_08054 [Rhizobiales bacterium GAS113]SEC13182.1 hypothetical protein SAMN05444161_0566 [Rhizobiales bacterium GAS191]SED07448.1 hypothetical protein SAMN05519104_2735 [Rhizobiales bacterium GAS188]